MSAPARTYFCKNGHVVADYGHGVLGPDFFDDSVEDECPDRCPVCGCSEIRNHHEWGDSDYEQCIPVEPTGQTEVGREDHRGNRYFVLINQYDVSRLFDDAETKES